MLLLYAAIGFDAVRELLLGIGGRNHIIFTKALGKEAVVISANVGFAIFEGDFFSLGEPGFLENFLRRGIPGIIADECGGFVGVFAALF